MLICYASPSFLAFTLPSHLFTLHSEAKSRLTIFPIDILASLILLAVSFVPLGFSSIFHMPFLYTLDDLMDPHKLMLGKLNVTIVEATNRWAWGSWSSSPWSPSWFQTLIGHWNSRDVCVWKKQNLRQGVGCHRSYWDKLHGDHAFKGIPPRMQTYQRVIVARRWVLR